MSKTHYETLEIGPSATQQEIARAYRKLAMIYHPDRRPSGNGEIFQAITAAYEVLSDSDKRRAYDRDQRGVRKETPFERYEREGLRFTLPKNLDQLNYYEYYNALFSLEGEAQIGPGMALDWEELKNRVGYVSSEISSERHQLQDGFKQAPYWEARKRCAFIKKHIEKIYWLRTLIFDSELNRRRHIYDISLGYYGNNDDREIVKELGGIAVIQAALKRSPYLDFAGFVSILHKAKLLTAKNFIKSSRANYPPSFSILEDIQKVGLLTQNNLDFLLQEKVSSDYYPHYAANAGIACLSEAGLLDQKNFERVIRAGRRGDSLAFSLKALHDFDLFTAETEQVALSKISTIWLPNALHRMQTNGELSREQTKILHWTPPATLNNLCIHLNQLFAHGLFLLTVAADQGKAAMLLALELKTDLKRFAMRSPEEQTAEKEVFSQSFISKLHSKDKMMSLHRDYWKVIVANVLIACSVIGFFALGVNYLLTRQCFFSKTNREKCIATIDKNILADFATAKPY